MYFPLGMYTKDKRTVMKSQAAFSYIIFGRNIVTATFKIQ